MKLKVFWSDLQTERWGWMSMWSTREDHFSAFNLLNIYSLTNSYWLFLLLNFWVFKQLVIFSSKLIINFFLNFHEINKIITRRWRVSKNVKQFSSNSTLFIAFIFWTVYSKFLMFTSQFFNPKNNNKTIQEERKIKFYKHYDRDTNDGIIIIYIHHLTLSLCFVYATN